MRYAPFFAALSLSIWAAACGGEPGGGGGEGGECTATDSPLGAGLYSSVQDFDLSGCEAGSLESFDPTGSWYYEQENHGIFFGSGPAHFDLSCDEGLDVAIGGSITRIPIEEHTLDGDALFWRRERRFDNFDFTLIEGWMICAEGADGSYLGRAVRCEITAEGENCGETGLRLSPFDRLPDEADASGLSLVSEYNGPDDEWLGNFAANVRVLGDFAYVALDEGGLRIVDISDIEAPVEVGAFAAQDGEGFNDVKMVENAEGRPYALMASNSRGMVVIDVGDPTSPRLVVSVTQTGDPNEGIHTLFTEVVADKTMAYLADGFSNLVTIWDVTDPETPVRAGAYELADPDWAVHDLYVEQGRMYLNGTVGGMVVVDTQPNPANPVEVGHFVPDQLTYSHSNWVTRIGDRTVTVHGDEGFDAHFRVVDVDPDSPDFMKEIGSYRTRPEVSAHNVMAFGNKAYAAYYQDGVRILDLSDPTNPTEAAHFNTWEPANAPGGRFEGAVGLDLDLDRGLIFVADNPRGLLILREE